MKMNCFNRLKTPILLLGLWVCLVSISSFRLATATAEEGQGNSTKTARTEVNKEKAIPAATAEKKTPPPDEKPVESTDPNTPGDKETDDDSDIFDVKFSTYVLINQTYDRIFTPELISEEGLVKYSTLKRRRLDIIDAKRELKKLNPVILMNLSKEERTAFWINTYNFCTIKLILENYLIQPDGHYQIPPKWYMIIYPDNSIMQITGAWTKEFHEIQREEYTLREIEQDFLLKRYKDPRICFALSNASVGGATLRNEPYTAERLNEQLNDQVKKYLATDKGMHWDKEENTLYLSNIFQAHTKTFLDSDLAKIKKFRKRKDEERVWFNFLAPYFSNEDVRRLEDKDTRVRFIDFDWHLNEAK